MLPLHTGRLGTPHFMSPEVIDRKPYGKPIDVWGCGKNLSLYSLYRSAFFLLPSELVRIKIIEMLSCVGFSL